MPTYEYLCSNCGYHFEHFQAMSDSPLDDCPQCEGSVRRLVSGGSGLIFKGSGFYLTDYKRKSNASGSSSVKQHTNKTISDKKGGKPESGTKKESN